MTNNKQSKKEIGLGLVIGFIICIILVMAFMWLSTIHRPITNVTKQEKPIQYTPSLSIQHKADSVLLIIKHMTIRDSFYFASMDAYLKNKKRLGNRLKDSAIKYERLIGSFNK